ncbi:MAG: helix-turn-helix transcriptional regulator [Clostridia bacterium]|nr:helix-turn-helix transcriptional regulator [Clostridia bacterium]
MFKENFIKLCNKKGEAPTVVCINIGLSKTSFSKWDNTTIPREATLHKIADYFGVTVDYLLGKEEKKEEPPQGLYVEETQNIHLIPVFETVSAGFGSLATDCIIDYMPLFISNPYEAENTLCIKVKGDSMYPKIENGDIIQVHKQDMVESGQIAVVLIDSEEGRVKKVVYGDDWIELHSINPMYKTERYNGKDASRVKILGLVRKVIKEI